MHFEYIAGEKFFFLVMMFILKFLTFTLFLPIFISLLPSDATAHGIMQVSCSILIFFATIEMD
jgi:hypothetical protein